jgi:predicted SprT family Zn-dependent metalloprotease
MKKTEYHCVNCGIQGLMVDDSDDYYYGPTYHCKLCETKFSFTEWSK